MKWLHREIVVEPDLPAELADERDQPSSTSGTSAARSSAGCPPRCWSTPSTQATAGTAALGQGGDRRSETASIGPKAGQGSPATARATTTPRGSSAARHATPTATATASNEPNLLQSIYLQNDQEMLSAHRPHAAAGSPSAPATQAAEGGRQAREQLEGRSPHSRATTWPQAESAQGRRG